MSGLSAIVFQISSAPVGDRRMRITKLDGGKVMLTLDPFSPVGMVILDLDATDKAAICEALGYKAGA